MVSGSVKTEGVFCWANFLANITKMARTRDMFTLNVVLQPLSVFVAVFTIQTYPLSKFSSSHLRRYQLLKMTWKIMFSGFQFSLKVSYTDSIATLKRWKLN